MNETNPQESGSDAAGRGAEQVGEAATGGDEQQLHGAEQRQHREHHLLGGHGHSGERGHDGEHGHDREHGHGGEHGHDREHGHDGEHRHAVGTWVNTKLLKVMGPPPVGPYDDSVEKPTSDAPCPLCGAPMSQHIIDRSGRDAELVCPAPPAPPVHEPTAP